MLPCGGMVMNKKGNQKRPLDIAGEIYINDVLVPAMDENGFYNQEGILFI